MNNLLLYNEIKRKKEKKRKEALAISCNDDNTIITLQYGCCH